MFSQKSKSLAAVCTASSLLLLLCLALVQGKTDHNKPHPHGALLKPYSPTNPFQGISLSRKDESLLLDGKPVTKQTMPDKDDPDGGAGGAICVQDVQAPPFGIKFWI
jgi:hypothetical protein